MFSKTAYQTKNWCKTSHIFSNIWRTISYWKMVSKICVWLKAQRYISFSLKCSIQRIVLYPKQYDELIKITFIWNIYQCCGYLTKHKETVLDSLQCERFASTTNDQDQWDTQNHKAHTWKISLVNTLFNFILMAGHLLLTQMQRLLSVQWDEKLTMQGGKKNTKSIGMPTMLLPHIWKCFITHSPDRFFMVFLSPSRNMLS